MGHCSSTIPRRAIVLALFTVIVLSVPVFSSGRSLIISECVADPDGVCRLVELVRYDFANGKLAHRENLRQPRNKEVKFEAGMNRIHMNRYVISYWGDIFDLEDNTLLHEGIGKFIGIEGDKVFHRVDNIDVESGVYVFDLSDKTYRRLTEPGKWALPGVLAPDGKKSFHVPPFDGNTSFHTLNGRKAPCIAGLGSEVSHYSSEAGNHAPVIWIDDETVLSQTSNGNLVLVGTDGTIRPLVSIPDLELPILSPRLSRNPEGRIVYTCGHSDFEIDVEQGSFRKMRWLPLGHGFDIELDGGTNHVRRIRHNGEVIGQYCCFYNSAITAEGQIAVEYYKAGPIIHSYHSWVAVWSAESGEWTKLPTGTIDSVIGWVKN